MKITEKKAETKVEAKVPEKVTANVPKEVKKVELLVLTPDFGREDFNQTFKALADKINELVSRQ